ncbi:Rac GTPase-activating protein 1 [Nymphon striatum]|nr:Rac GTPase-activating protein 1 [Nymphon striatum]
MVSVVSNKMSLTAQYDDLCRFHSHIHGTNDKAESEIKHLETKLLHSRNLSMTEMNRRKQAEAEKASLQRQIAVIKEMLTDQNVVDDQTREKFAVLENTNTWNNIFSPTKPSLDAINETPESLIDSSLVDFDESNNYLEGNQYGYHLRGKRSNGFKTKDSPKRRKSDELNNSIVATTTVTVPENGPIHATTKIEAGKSEKKLKSESAPQSATEDKKLTANNYQHKYPTTPLPSVNHSEKYTPSNRQPPIRTFPSVGKLTKRAHIFCQKLVVYPETCGPCGKKIAFYKNALKCEDCRLTCHSECKDKAPLPCIPSTATPTGKVRGVIADYTPLTSPMIPPLIVYCVNEVERRGFNEVGIYRLSGPEKDVKELTEKFRQGKGCPNLSKEDIHVICSVIKSFLRTLKEALIPFSLWNDFVQAAENNNFQDGIAAMYQAIDGLPQPNRDTLAFMMIHLQKVAECTECKMPANNLSIIFGPTIVGYTDVQNMQKMIKENSSQKAVIDMLLKIPSDYWRSFVNDEQENSLYNKTPNTPEYRKTPHASMLGPITTSGQKSKNQGSLSNRAKNIFGRTPLSSRHGRSTKKPQYFSSPMLK